MPQNKSVEELAKELRMVANMINMGEKIQWARETTLMDEAADMLEEIRQTSQEREREIVEKLESIMRVDIGDASPTRIELQKLLNTLTNPNKD